MNKNEEMVHKMTKTAIFLCLGVISTTLFKMIPMGPFPFLRFSLTPALTIFSSVAIGPFYGMVVGVGSDLIPSLIFPVGGAPNFFLYIVYGLLGILPYFFMKLATKFKKAIANPYSIGGVLLLSLLLLSLTFYVNPSLDSAFGDLAPVLKPVLLALSALLDALLFVGVLFLQRRREKKGIGVSYSPYEIAFVAILSELILILLGKSFAFYAFYCLLAGNSYFSYWYFFSMLLLGYPVFLLIDISFLSWLFPFDYNLKHKFR